MTLRQLIITVVFAAAWSAFMVWWSADTSASNILILSAIGILVAGTFAWTMKRVGYWAA